MLSKLFLLQAALPLIIQHTSAQIIQGNTQLPACAQTCTLLVQATQACAAAPNTWSCFCQSGYLGPLRNPTPASVCDAFCPNAADNQAVVTWFKTECGNDFGVSEHPNAGGAGQGTTTTTAAGGAQQTTATSSRTASTVSGTAAAGSFVPVGVDGNHGNWWANSYKWVIMLLVIFIGLGLLTWLLLWLKKRRARKQDSVVGTFNEGITMRSTPMTTVEPAVVHSSSGRDSPVRTRDAFMPYGYGYSRSESRLGSRTDVSQTHIKGSPLAHDGTTIDDIEKSGYDSQAGGKKKRIYVREREYSGRDSPEMERR